VPWPLCTGRGWTTKHVEQVIPAAKGLSVEHRQKGRAFVHRESHVQVEGTYKDDITVLIDVKATSGVIVENIDISLVNGNEIIITVYPTETELTIDG
jgi:hypothetical protein